jgi:hypothetical protein
MDLLASKLSGRHHVSSGPVPLLYSIDSYIYPLNIYLANLSPLMHYSSLSVGEMRW